MGRVTFALPVALALLLAAINTSLAASQPCVDVVSDQTGHIVGEPQNPHCTEKSFDADEFHHLVRVDSAGRGLIHEPLVLVKSVDASSPALWRAHRDRETLTVVIDFWRPTQTGAEEKFYVVTLKGAKIEAIEPITLDDKMPDAGSIPDRERLRIAYSSMTVDFIPTSESHTLSAPSPQ